MSTPLHLTQGHFALLLTGIEGPLRSFPRLNPSDPPIALLLSRRKSNPPRYNVFGGGRRNELTGVQVLRREVAEEAGPDMSWELFGPLGHPLFAKIPVASPTKADTAYAYLCLHTGGEPLLETPETTDYARVTPSKVVAKQYGKPDSDGKAAGAVRYYGDLPYVKGTTAGVLARTERMIQWGLTLCQSPVACLNFATGELVGTLPEGHLSSGHAFGAGIDEYKHPEERFYADDRFIWIRTTDYAAVWELVDPQPLFDARAL